MVHLTHHFERVCVISLRDRPDRRLRLQAHLENFGVKKSEVEWLKAYSGHLVPHPSWWNAGPGAWGCFLSHSRALADALEDEVTSILVLEDDVVFRSDIVELLEALVKQVPQDWGQLYLGGQHATEPKPLANSALVQRANKVYRTHAYAVHRRAMKGVFEHLWNVEDYRDSRHGWHIDHQFGLGHARELWRVYSPIYWLAGQEAEWSNISGAINPRFWWHPGFWAKRLPFIWISDFSEDNFADSKQQVYLGDLRQESSADTDCSRDEMELRLARIAKLALAQEKLPAVRGGSISREQLAGFWSGTVVDWSPQTIHSTWRAAYECIEAELREAAGVGCLSVRG